MSQAAKRFKLSGQLIFYFLFAVLNCYYSRFSFDFRCDLTSPTITQKPVGFLTATSAGPVNFLAQRKAGFSGGNNFGGFDRLTYDFTLVNNGDAMNPTKGTFTAPKSGRYQFTFSAISSYVGTIASLLWNDNFVAAAYAVGSSATSLTNRFTLSLSVILSLKAGDTVGIILKGQTIANYQGGVDDGSFCNNFLQCTFHTTNFAGMLIDEDQTFYSQLG